MENNRCMGLSIVAVASDEYPNSGYVSITLLGNPQSTSLWKRIGDEWNLSGRAVDSECLHIKVEIIYDPRQSYLWVRDD